MVTLRIGVQTARRIGQGHDEITPAESIEMVVFSGETFGKSRWKTVL